MRQYRWMWVALTLSAVAAAVLVFGTWPWAWPFILMSYFCSYRQAKGPLANRRLSLAGEADEIIRLAREQAPISGSCLTAVERSLPYRRTFEPFCGCPRCGLPNYHLFSAPFQHVERQPEWVAGPGRLWVEEETEEVSVWNSPGTYRVRRRETGAVVVKKQVSTCVHRECLTCRHEWTETMS